MGDVPVKLCGAFIEKICRAGVGVLKEVVNRVEGAIVELGKFAESARLAPPHGLGKGVEGVSVVFEKRL